MDKIGSLIGSTRVTLISARDHQQEALDYQKQGNLNRAQASYLEALDVAQQAHRIAYQANRTNSTKANINRTLAQINQDYAGLLERLGRYADAEKAYQQAKDYGKETCELEPDHAESKALLDEIKFKHKQFLSLQEKSTAIDQEHKEKVPSVPPPDRVQPALPAQRLPAVVVIQEKSALVDRLFEKALSTLASWEVPNKHSLFLVYAHNNPACGEAKADISKYLIEKLSTIRALLYSDQTPMGPTYSNSVEEAKDGKLEDILTSQLCLLPVKLRDGVEPVDKVVVCCSEVLGNYLTWPHYQDFYQALLAAYRKDLEQRSTTAIREVVKQFSQEAAYKSGFHHILTEIAFLQIRAEHRKDQHGIIPVSLTHNSYESCLADFIPATTVRMEDVLRFEAQAQTGRVVYANQSRHWVLFKLIERVLVVDSDEARTFLNKFWHGYEDLIARLNEAPLALSALEFDKLVEGIFKEVETAWLKQLAHTLDEIQEAQRQSLKAAPQPLAILGEDIEKFKRSYQQSSRGTGESDVLSMYVPLQCIKKGPQGEEIVDLDAELERFFASEASVFLLQGDAGAGKSTFNRRLALKKLTDYHHLSQTSDDPSLVFFIELRSIENPNEQVIQQFLQRIGFAPVQIEALRTHLHQRCIFIFDGYDEIKERNRNFYELNELWLWEKAKFVITSRPEYLDANYQTYFCSKTSPQALWEAWVAPFSSAQRSCYIQNYVKEKNPPWSVAQYEEAFTQLTPLGKELERPVVLRMLLQILPGLEANHPIATSLTLGSVYEQYFQHWWGNWQGRLGAIPLTDEEKRAKQELAEREGGFIQQGLTYIQNCALALTKAKLTIAKDNKNFKNRYAEVYEAFFEEGAKARLLRFNAPFQIKQKQHYAFSHKSMQEYLVARAICEPEFEAMDPHPEDVLNQLSLVNEPVILDFLVEQVKTQPPFKEHLHAWIEASKNPDALVTVGAANAITVLVRARVHFISADLRAIRVPGADLSYGVFDSAQLKGTNLGKTNLTGTWLRNADLAGARMDGVQFGELPSLQLENGVSACCYSPDERYLVVATSKWDKPAKLALYEVETLAHVRTFEGHTDSVTSIVFSSDGQTLASGSKDQTVRLWSIADKKPLHTFKGHTDFMPSVAFSSDEQLLASNSADNTVRLWSVAEKKPLPSFEGHTDYVASVAFSSDGQTLASGSHDNTVRLWSVAKKKQLPSFEGHASSVKGVAFSSDGQTLASGGDNTVWLWSVAEKKTLYSFKGHTEEVTSVAFSSDGQTLASGSDDKTVRLWDVAKRKPLYTFKGHAHGVTSVAFSSDGQTLASGSSDNTVRLWSVAEEKLLCELEGDCSFVFSVAFSSVTQMLAWGGIGTRVQLWSVAEKKRLPSFEGHRASVANVVFSSDGQMLASASWDNKVGLWSVAKQKPLHLLEGHTEGVQSVSFSSDGKILASGSHDKTVRLWSVASGKCLAIIRGFNGSVNSIDWRTSDERVLLATGSNDKVIRLWQVHRNGEACRVTLHWASAQTTLAAPDMCIQDVIGLSARNTKLLKQRGATGEPHQPEEQEARSLPTERAEEPAFTLPAQANNSSGSMHPNFA